MGKSLSSRCRERQRSKSHTHTHKTARCVHGHTKLKTESAASSYSSTINGGAKEEPWRIQAWLSPLEPYGRHQDVSNGRQNNVGDWVLQKNEFKTWCKSQNGSVNPTLLCWGSQGVGKTYIRYRSISRNHRGMLIRNKISSLVIDTLYEQARRAGVVVLFFYCDNRAHESQSAVNIIGSLLRQFALGALGIPEGIHSAFEESRQGGGKGLKLLDMVELFVKTISSIERAYICIDAADELLPQDRSEFLNALGQIIREVPNTRLFLTGRPHIRGEIEKRLTDGTYSINVVVDQGDIARHLSRKMDDDNARDEDVMTEDLKSDIMGGMSETSSEK